MNESDWEHLSDAARRQNARIAALEKSCQAILAAYQDVSAVLAQAQYRIPELENRLAVVEEHRAWTERDTALLDRIDDEVKTTVQAALSKFRADYGEVLNMWRLQIVEETKCQVQ